MAQNLSKWPQKAKVDKISDRIIFADGETLAQNPSVINQML